MAWLWRHSASTVWVVVASALLVGTGLVGGGAAPTARAGDAVAPLAESQEVATPLAEPEQVTKPQVWPPQVYWSDHRPTMCVPFPPEFALDVTVVNCGVEHEEVMGHTTLAGPAMWPGWTAVDEAARASCRSVFEDYMGVTYDDARWWVDYLTVDEAEWDDGERTVVCAVWDPYQEVLTAPFNSSDE